MNIQNSLLCILYILLIIAHSCTLSHKGFHRGLISIFSFALLTQTLATVFFALHQVVVTYGRQIVEVANIDLSPFYNIHYFAQLIHITSINFFILFLLIIAKGWPITRRDMPFKYAFAIFWILCLAADLITFYWATITLLAKNFTNLEDNSTFGLNGTSIIESLPRDTEQFNSTPRRLSLLLRIIIMLYFLLELRTTMILEQEQKKLQFYLHFGALSMVWFVHSLIVYVISLRVEIVWQSKLISGFSSAANFLAFAVTTRLLWPKCSRSYLFRKAKANNYHHGQAEMGDVTELDNFSTPISLNEDEFYEGLEMRDLNEIKTMTNDNNQINRTENGSDMPLNIKNGEM